VVRAVANDERSQHRNREIALVRLRDRVRDALRVDRPRVATKPSAASRERRLQEKRRQALRKKERSKRHSTDD